MLNKWRVICTMEKCMCEINHILRHWYFESRVHFFRANEDLPCQSEFRRRPTNISGLRTTSYRKKWLASFSLKSDTCAICLDDFRYKEDISICRCGHAYHCKCIMEWMEIKETCPICQHNYRQKNEIQNDERAPLLFNIDL